MSNLNNQKNIEKDSEYSLSAVPSYKKNTGVMGSNGGISRIYILYS